MSKNMQYQEVELDRPDLNKCPECGCFFASDTCPLCKQVCPEHMRAGNRAPVKPQKVKKNRDNGRVKFIRWYHEWWFIVILFLIMPLAGLVVLFTSPHKFRSKILFVVGYLTIPAILSFVLMLGGSAILSWLTPDPVDTSLTKEAYVQRCAEVDPETYFRSPEAYEKAYVKMTLTVEKSTWHATGTSGDTYYLCRAEGHENFYLIVRDCLLDGEQNLLPGDSVTIYGQYGGSATVTDTDGLHYTAPCINAAYIAVNAVE